MYKGFSFLGVIPARKGSKRLPNKNVKPLLGKPLIAWTIEEALKSKYLDRVIVNSDDERIEKIAKEYKVEFFKRPNYLGRDTVPTVDVIIHMLENLKASYDFVVLLQPTSPLRKSFHIDGAVEEIVEKKANAVVSVTPAAHPPVWCGTLDENNKMDTFIKNLELKRSQDLPTFYCLNGAIYICKTEILLKEKTFFPKKGTYAYIMERKYSVDIDDIVDFKIAECLIKIGI